MTEPRAGDLALAKRMIAGDERAFTEFFESHFSRLFRFAMTRLEGKADVAEEVAQAALCAAVSRLSTYRGESSLFTWICAICRHEIWRYYDRRGGPQATVSLPEESEEARAAIDSLASAASQGPEARLERREEARLVQVALDNLPSSYASALEWKYLEDMPVREIAARLRVSEKAAESLLTRARAAFRDSFAILTGAERNMRMGKP